MKRPDEIKLSQADGEALIERLEGDALTVDDRRVLVQVLRLHFWMLFALQEAKISLKRLRMLLFGKRPKTLEEPPSGESSASGGGSETRSEESSQAAGDAVENHANGRDPSAGGRRPGHGRQGAKAYGGAERVMCRHAALAVGERCPVCGQGWLYQLPPGVEMRIDGNALLSAVRYELEKLRCSACGQVFTAVLPDKAGQGKYSPRARAVLALGRYYLGVPLYRLEGYQAMVEVPVSDATQWDQIEALADCAYPVFEHLKALAAQGELIYQDDTPVRILSLIKENRQAEAQANDPSQPSGRTGMYTTGLVVQHGERTICLYVAGRAHAGENLEVLLAQREAGRAKPLVMSDALSRNEAEEGALIRCHCLAHGRRKFAELEEVFPQECAEVIDALKHVFDHEAEAREQQMSARERLTYHQHYSGPIMDGLKHWLEKQGKDRTVEPNSSLGKAVSYLLGHWQTLTRFLQVEGAPLDNNAVERALKLCIRQRKNSLFYATEHSAYIASLLTSLIATCLHAGVNTLEYLVALQEHRAEVFGDPAAWLPWNYDANLVPP
jgi:transposase